MSPLLVDLIADAPDYYRRMVAVAPDEVAQVAFVPLVEITTVVIFVFLLAPHIESLVHDHYAQRVAHVEQLGRGRIMGSAHGVGAHLL